MFGKYETNINTKGDIKVTLFTLKISSELNLIRACRFGGLDTTTKEQLFAISDISFTKCKIRDYHFLIKQK